MNLFSTHHTCLCPPSPHTNYQAPNHQNTQFLHVYCFEHPPAFLSNFLNVHMRLSNFLQVFFLPCCDHFFVMFQHTHTYTYIFCMYGEVERWGGHVYPRAHSYKGQRTTSDSLRCHLSCYFVCFALRQSPTK